MNMNNFLLLCQVFLNWKIIEETNSINEDSLLAKYPIIQQKENL